MSTDGDNNSEDSSSGLEEVPPKEREYAFCQQKKDTTVTKPKKTFKCTFAGCEKEIFSEEGRLKLHEAQHHNKHCIKIFN